MEKEEIEEQDDEMMSNEAFDLVADLNSTVAYGESLGVFTPKEAAEWYIGIDACVKISHLKGLMPYLNRFIASGEARLHQLEKSANNDLLTISEQRRYINQANRITYRAKGQLIEEINSLVKELSILRNRLLSILSRKKVAVGDQGALINKFYSVSANSKSGVVDEAESILIATESIRVVKEKSVNPDSAPNKPEIVESVRALKDPKTDCLNWVEHYCQHDQFSQAVDLLEAHSRYFNLVEYRSWLKRIDRAKLSKEIPDLKALLQEA